MKRPFCLGFILLVLPLFGTLQASQDDSLHAMIQQFFHADTMEDQSDAARMILPRDLGMAKKVVLDAFTDAEEAEIDVIEMLWPYFGNIATMDDFEEVDSVTFYIGLCEWMFESIPELKDDIKASKYELLGIVNDTPTSKYMIYRNTNPIQTSVGSLVAVYEDDRWYISLDGSWVRIRNSVLANLAYLTSNGAGF